MHETQSSALDKAIAGDNNQRKKSLKPDAVGDSRLRSRCRHLANLTKHTRHLILAHSLHYVKIRRHPYNRKYITYCIAVRRSQYFAARPGAE